MSTYTDSVQEVRVNAVPLQIKKTGSHASQDDSLQRSELLVATIQQLSQAATLDQVVATVRSAARRLTSSDGATFVLLSGTECHYADEDAIAPLWKGRRFAASQCISGWVMQHRSPVTIPDIYSDKRIPADTYKPTFVRSLAMVPIRTQDPIGAIGNYWAQSHVPTTFEMRLLQALADSTSVAMEKIRILAEMEARVLERTEQLETINKELRAEADLRKQMEAKVMRLSLTDELTSLSNRRGFLMRTEQMLKLIHRMGACAWLFYIDLDGLKQLNDTFGHEAGDRQIQSAARVLRESFRESDILSRIGGDEFLIFAIGSQLNPAAAEQRIQEKIDQHNLLHPNDPPIAMSIGSVRCDPSTIALEPLIREADAAMYRNKNRKRELTHTA